MREIATPWGVTETGGAQAEGLVLRGVEIARQAQVRDLDPGVGQGLVANVRRADDRRIRTAETSDRVTSTHVTNVRVKRKTRRRKKDILMRGRRRGLLEKPTMSKVRRLLLGLHEVQDEIVLINDWTHSLGTVYVQFSVSCDPIVSFKSVLNAVKKFLVNSLAVLCTAPISLLCNDVL